MRGGALGYLLGTRLRNALVGFFKKPVRLIYVVIFIGLLAVTLIGGKAGASEEDRVVRNFSELTAGLNVLLIIMFATNFSSVLNNGGTFFKMADVNFLFPSPLSKRSILFYALIQQIWTFMLVGIFILFQYSTLHVAYDLNFGGLLLIFLLYSLNVLFSQTFAMFIYTFVSDSDGKKRLAKIILYILLTVLVAFVGLHILQNRADAIGALAEAGNALPVRLFPFAGWMGGLTASLLMGSYGTAALFLALIAIGFAGTVIAMARSKRDYYEDVLAAAETTQSTMNAAKNGVAPEMSPRNIRVGKTGIHKGEGASVFFYKHMLENRRASRLWVRPMSIMFIVMTTVFAFFLKGSGLIPIFAFSVYVMIFTVALGRFNRELLKPYIYLVPEPPFKKLMFALLESLPTELLESVLVFIPLAFILDLSPFICILAVLARVSFAALFLCSSIAIERIWGGTLSKLAGMFIYLLASLFLSAPGMILAIVLGVSGITLFDQTVTTLLSLVALNLPVAALLLFLSRNVLQYAETT